MQSLGAFLQCHKNPYATFKSLESFRQFYPDSTVVLISDNGYNYSEMAKHFNCIYIHSNENLQFVFNNLATNDLKINHMKQLSERVKECFKLCKEEYIIWLEDDVIVTDKITDTFNYDMNGCCPNNINHIDMHELKNDFSCIDPNKIYIRNGHGGTVFHKNNFIRYLENKEILNKLLDRYYVYRGPWEQDFIFSMITILNNGTIGPYKGQGDCYGNMLSPHLCVQHQYKKHYGQPLPIELIHLLS